MQKAWEIRVRGLVQGVGFRPFVWQLAHAAGLRGEVLNDAEGVIIRLNATRQQLEDLEAALRNDIPPLARIDAIETSPYEPHSEWTDFSIVASEQGQITTGIVPDAATCADCLHDITDPGNRRYGYAFTNCTNCGPRLSITQAIPYDRCNTAMAMFRMCPSCQAEYDDPANRRFHAQPNACPDCGPQLKLTDAKGMQISGDPILTVVQALQDGQIVAIKGLGGVQLAVDAGNAQAVIRLRHRKRRQAKPLALMATDVAMVARYARVNDLATQLLTSPQAPIVLLRIEGAALAAEIAPDQNRLGFMLPNTPLHHLVMRRLDRPLVMTSGNLSDEPQVTDNAAAYERLSDIADLWLLHDRGIVNRLDDSVVQQVGDSVQILRRARGYAPAPLRLHAGFASAPPIFAAGADLKNTFCLLKDGQAIVSQHMGDMQNPETQRDFIANLDLYRQIYHFTPEKVAIDLHPGYFSTRLGQKIAARENAKLCTVQHHHAHIAAVLAEHGCSPDCAPVLGVVLDGLGQGDDGTIWGGEFLRADFQQYERLAHFSPIALPGGDKANQQPWRNLFAHLLAAFDAKDLMQVQEEFGALSLFTALQKKPVQMMAQLIERELNAPVASSAGRLFDAVAAALGLCFDTVQFEGQAAMQLQVLAEACGIDAGTYAIAPHSQIRWTGLWRGILNDLAVDVPIETIAARFHNSLIRVICDQTQQLAKTHQINQIVLCGGVMQNAYLLSGVNIALQEAGFNVLLPEKFPTNDGAIALGQACITAAFISA